MTHTRTGTLVEVDTAAGRVRGAWRSGCRGPRARPPSSASPSPSRPSASCASPRPCRTAPWEGVRDAHRVRRDGAARRPRRDAHPRAVGPGRVDAERERLHARSRRRTPALPVLVYIHGGGYFAGSPASPWYDGAAFNRDGVVTVSISYRLGFDGFGWIADAPSNRGVLDWLLALEWVRDNIARVRRRSRPGHDRRPVGRRRRGAHAARHAARRSTSSTGVYASRARRPTSRLAAPSAFGRRLAELGGVEPTRAGFAR